MNFKIHTTAKKILADTVTPVSIYLRLRDRYQNSILLESSDHHGNENNFSYICFKPLAGLKLEDELLQLSFPDGTRERKQMQGLKLTDEIQDFISKFNLADNDGRTSAGLFGYITYDTVRYFEDIDPVRAASGAKKIPDIRYHLYQYVIAIDHSRDELTIYENFLDEPQGISSIESLISNRNLPRFGFRKKGEEQSNLSNEEFKALVRKGKEHCRRGDVFQVVFSREFSVGFAGDEFNVYRALRSVNPSPYLFFFDYGDFRLFGSSPEAQLVVKNGRSSIHPIAGTFRRTGDDESDKQLAVRLLGDVKENAEHVMLVDLARNDLGRNCDAIEVENFREVQFYSHVIHLVSKVSGKVKQDRGVMRLVGDTFPAGTLSGAPKHRAMQLIGKYEKENRGFYGGCIGFLGFDGTFNSAIMIRSFLSKNNRLYYQAGAGVVANSDEESELNEVNNKLGALKKAIVLAETL